MASLNGTFDASTVEPSAPIEIIPPGDYTVQIIESDMVPTKANDGQMLNLTMEVLDGPARGRRLWDRLNLVNNNQQAVEIAQRTLSAICHAVGQIQVSDSEMLHFKPMIAKVKVKPAGKDKHGIWREAKNEIGGYKPAGGAASPAAPAIQQQRPAANPPPAQARPAGQPIPPWRRTA